MRAISRLNSLSCTLAAHKRYFGDQETNEAVLEALKHTHKQPSKANVIAHYRAMALINQFNDFCLSSSESALVEFIDQRVSIDKPEYWQQVQEHDGPVIFVTPHYGPFALGCLKATLDMGAKKRVNAFYDPPEKNPTTAIYKDILGRLGDRFNPIFNDNRGLVKAIRSLKNKEIVTMMPDVYELTGQSISVPFFSHFTVAMAGTAFLALKTNALIMSGYCEPTADLNVTCKLDAPFLFESSDDFEQDLFSLTSRLFKSMERQVGSAPEHWIYLRQLSERLEMPLPHTEAFKEDESKIITLGRSFGIDEQNIRALLRQLSRLQA